MVKNRGTYRRCMLILLCTLAFACSNDLTDDAIPFVSFNDIQINLALPHYVSLLSTGGSMAISNGGIRGIILYRLDSHTVLAFERNCSFQPLNACATVDVHSSRLYMQDVCCNSTFRFDDGAPAGGPAWRPLQQYATVLNGNTLTITDKIIT